MSTSEFDARLRHDFPFYARESLQIRPENGGLSPLLLNPAQLILHEQLEQQRKARGYVKAIILKARQLGCSTYVEALFFWLITHSFGKQAYILTHEDKATQNLFGMAKRFLDNLPPGTKPSMGSESAKALVFDKLDSNYIVGTAGTKHTGRSLTVNYFHGSEVAFWDNAEEHVTGVLQSIPTGGGSETILESTAFGPTGYFYETWTKAVQGDNKFLPIFIPWFVVPKYYEEPQGDLALTDDEARLKELHSLSDGQLLWRRGKIADFNGDVLKFKQEYPSNADEAFSSTAERRFMVADHILDARKFKSMRGEGMVIIGFDPARFGDDDSGLIVRKGRRVIEASRVHGMDTQRGADFVSAKMKEYKADLIFIDVVGVGAGVVDRLRALGYGRRLIAVNGANKPRDRKYANKRAECWGRMRDWFAEQPVYIPDSEALQAQLLTPDYKYDVHNRILLESKEDMRRKGKKSPDLGDAFAMTFAEEVGFEDDEESRDGRELVETGRNAHGGY